MDLSEPRHGTTDLQAVAAATVHTEQKNDSSSLSLSTFQDDNIVTLTSDL